MTPLGAGRLGTRLELPVPAEPTELKRSLRAMAEEQPGQAMVRLTEPDTVAAHLWDSWADALHRAGLDRSDLMSALAGYRQELWYWVWSNRTWNQCVQGLAGRIARRAGRLSTPGPGAG